MVSLPVGTYGDVKMISGLLSFVPLGGRCMSNLQRSNSIGPINHQVVPYFPRGVRSFPPPLCLSTCSRPIDTVMA